MKIAICVSGQPRNFRQSYKSLKKYLLDKYDCDVYFHTWKADTFESTNFGFGNHQYDLNRDDFFDLISLFEPKKYSLETPITFDASDYRCPIWRQPLNNTLSMFYSNYRAFQLVESEYDYVVRTRFDIDYSKLNLELPEDGLTVPEWNTDLRVQSRGYYDAFALGRQKDMEVYSQVFSNIISYIALDAEFLESLSGGWPEQDSPLRNEYLLKWHLIKNNIKVKQLPTLEIKADAGIIR